MVRCRRRRGGGGAGPIFVTCFPFDFSTAEFWHKSYVFNYDHNILYINDVPYYPSSSSIFTTNYNVVNLNLRFVNYRILENGAYQFSCGDTSVKTVNCLCKMSPTEKHRVLRMLVVDDVLVRDKCKYNYDAGLEDIRLFDWSSSDSSNICSYTASVRLDDGTTRIMYGGYDLIGGIILSGKIIESPTGQFCEKNWTPFWRTNIDPQFEYKLDFVYKWTPFQCGKYNDVKQKLNKLRDYTDVKMPTQFGDLRGSSTFVRVGSGQIVRVGNKNKFVESRENRTSYIAVLHYCDDTTTPRSYYHLLVLADVNHTPTHYSDPFYFCKRGIEFCTGFKVSEHAQKFQFWISRNDGNPACIYAGFNVFSWNKI
jgi:hypothetical protein